VIYGDGRRFVAMRMRSVQVLLAGGWLLAGEAWGEIRSFAWNNSGSGVFANSGWWEMREERLLAPDIYVRAFASDGSASGCDDPLPEIEEIDASIPGQITLTIRVGTCGINRLQDSQDLATWRTFVTVISDVTGRAQVVDRRRSMFPRLFYRVVRN
jgi:hypothetical protein